jgi:transcriptional regulator GlxA family with amidase domain
MTPSKPRLVAFTAYDGMRLLDLTGPLDAFAFANDLHHSDAPDPYVLRVLSESGGPVGTSCGLAIATEPLSSLDEQEIDTLIVAGGSAALRADSTPAAVHAWLETRKLLVDWVARRAPRTRRVCSVCTGAFLLAAGRQLEGRCVATHWASVHLLANCFPSVRIDPNLMFARDGNVWTSGGVTTGIDLALALIEDDCGSELALRVARVMVMFPKRPGGQAQYSVPVAVPQSDPGDFAALHAWMAEHLADELNIEALAGRAGMSRRTFMRAYVAATGRTPAKTIEAMRIDAARVALEGTGRSLKHIARETGFGTEHRMRRVFLRQLDVSPADYRARFSLRLRATSVSRGAELALAN